MEDNHYEYAVVALENGEEKVILAPFTSLYYAREALANLRIRGSYVGKKLYLVKRSVSPWERYSRR